MFQALPTASALVALLYLAPPPVHAEDFTYTITNGSITITDYSGPPGAIVVPPSIEGLPVTAIAYPGFHFAQLSRVTIPETLVEIGQETLCSQTLQDILVNSNNPVFSSANGALLDKNGSKLVQYPSGRNGAYTIPTTVTTIGIEAFAFCANMAEVRMTTALTNIEPYAFSLCYSLNSVGLPDTLQAMGIGAFFSCTNLPTVRIPDALTFIPGWAFMHCTSLTNVTLGRNIEHIDGAAFADTSLTSIIIPKKVKGLYTAYWEGADGCFAHCTNLTAVYFEGDAPQADLYAFDNSPNVTCYYLPGTTGWSNTFAARPTAPWYLSNPVILTSEPAFGFRAGQFGFRVSWATNRTIAVDACTDLPNAKWEPVATNTLVDGWTDFCDKDQDLYHSRFYRLRVH